MASINELQEVSLGLTDKAVGLAREAFGTIFNQGSLAEAGRAQQDKGSHRLDAVRHEVKADAARAKAMGQERIQQANQDKPGSVTGNGGSEFSKGGPTEAGGGLLERVKGQAKETVGAITNDTSMRREGEAQQAKGEAKTQVAKEEAKAEAARAQVRTDGARQRASEESK